MKMWQRFYKAYLFACSLYSALFISILFSDLIGCVFCGEFTLFRDLNLVLMKFDFDTALSYVRNLYVEGFSGADWLHKGLNHALLLPLINSFISISQIFFSNKRPSALQWFVMVTGFLCVILITSLRVSMNGFPLPSFFPMLYPIVFLW